MVSNSEEITSLAALRAIAHPTRIRLYELLLGSGEATVSQLADELRLAVGSVSYHLQELHRVGFVEEVAASSGDRREHWWVAVPGGLRWSPADFLDSPGGRQASTAAQRALTERCVRRVGEWQNTWDQWERDWIDAAMETDAMLRLTPAELAAFAAEIQDVVRRWRSHGEDSGNKEPDKRREVFAFLSAFPVPGSKGG